MQAKHSLVVLAVSFAMRDYMAHFVLVSGNHEFGIDSANDAVEIVRSGVAAGLR